MHNVFLFRLREVSTPKTEGTLHHTRSSSCISFPCTFVVNTPINSKIYKMSTLFNTNFDFDVRVANDIAIDVAKCPLPGKQGSPCQ